MIRLDTVIEIWNDIFILRLKKHQAGLRVFHVFKVYLCIYVSLWVL